MYCSDMATVDFTLGSNVILVLDTHTHTHAMPAHRYMYARLYLWPPPYCSGPSLF